MDESPDVRDRLQWIFMAQPPVADRVVFMGNSITQGWAPLFPTLFAGKPYVGRGIGGQTTPQMLVRFRQDVVALRPKVVVIEGGTDDLASVFSPGTEATMGENIASMAELARIHGIRVVLASITPVCDCFAKPASVKATV